MDIAAVHFSSVGIVAVVARLSRKNQASAKLARVSESGQNQRGTSGEILCRASLNEAKIRSEDEISKALQS